MFNFIAAAVMTYLLVNVLIEPGQATRVEVRFEADGDGSRVTVEHSGWDGLADDHPVRHGMDPDAFGDMMGLWWADLLNAARRRVKAAKVGA